MTWDHPRGHAPLLAASALWHRQGGEPIEWDRRSLQDFEAYPVEELARRYDLVVIDHPHVGQVAGCAALLPFEGDLDDLRRGSVGASFESYHWQGRQWALPIDAASQVMAWVPDRLGQPPSSWQQLLALAKAGHAVLPLRPPHALMSLMTLCGLLGIALDAASRAPLFPATAAAAYDCLAQLAAACGDACHGQDPIAALEAMAAEGSPLCVAPLTYGYVSYSQPGFRAARVAFRDLLSPAGLPPRGSVLGGTGVAVSALGARRAEAVAFARWLAGGTIQRDVVATNGGQPGHAQAWEDDAVNAASLDFYRGTRRTLEASWVRPRHAGYMAFQQAASARVSDALRRGEPAPPLLAELNDWYVRSHA